MANVDGTLDSDFIHVAGDGRVPPDGFEAIDQATADPDTIDAHAGNDIVFAGDAPDVVFGGSGADILHGEAGGDGLFGQSGNDVLVGGNTGDLLDGDTGIDTASYAGSSGGVFVDMLFGLFSLGDAQGDDLISIENLVGSAFNDTLVGNSGRNLLEGGAGADFLDGVDGIDTVSYAGAGAGVAARLSGFGTGGDAQDDLLVAVENLTGSAFDDSLTGDLGGNTLTGDTGDDVLEGAAGADLLRGGAGSDAVSYANSAAGVTVALAGASPGTGSGGDAQGDTLVEIEDLVGSALADTLTGNGGSNQLEGGAGDDTLNGGGQLDVLDGGDGDDVLNGGRFVDSMAGGAGFDRVSYSGSTSGVTASLVTQSASGGDAFGGETFSGIEGLTGSASGDILTGDGAANVLKGNGGADTLTGGEGNDTLNGLSYGLIADADLLRGGLGDDIYSIDSDLDVVKEFGGAGTDTVNAHVSYTLATQVENLRLAGGLAIDGTGNGLANRIRGNAAANALDGGDGDDRLTGLGGADELTGGAGRDRFDYDQAAHSTAAAFDTITDFAQGEDRIDLATIDADTGTPGNQAFAFIGAADFTAAGQLRVTQVGGQTIVEANAGDDLAADLVIRLDGLLAPAASDFVL